MSESVIAPIAQLLVTTELPELGPGPRVGVWSQSALNAKLDALLPKTGLPSTRQDLVRALVLLWHDHLEASHTLSQGVENADGSFVHAIMHRREPDAGNSKYWWRRVGNHLAFPELARRVGELLAGSRQCEEADCDDIERIRLVTSAATGKKLAAQLLPGSRWDAAAFVDLCASASGAARQVELLREIQRIETEVLLAWLLAANPEP